MRNSKILTGKRGSELKEKLVAPLGSLAGVTSFLGSWQLCHNICLGTVSFLAIFGITSAGMPFLFLTKIALPFWIAAFVLLMITLVIFFRKRCISPSLILFNSGLITASAPFKALQSFILFFWSLGATLVLISIGLFIRNKFFRRQHER